MTKWSPETRKAARLKRLSHHPLIVPLPEEEWRDVPSWPGWKVSSLGRLSENGFFRPIMSDYRHVFLRVGDRCEQVSIIKLILLAFIGPAPEGKPLACHLDDNPENNTLTNAAWGSKQDNYEDALRNGKIDLGPERNAKISKTKKGKWIGGRGDATGTIAINNGITERKLKLGVELPSGWHLGSLRTGLIKITNGTEERSIRPEQSIPEGWRRGRCQSFIVAMQGKPSGMHGKVHSFETKQKMKNSHRPKKEIE